MGDKVRVLVFPCGSENGGEIYQSLRHSVHVDLFGASSVEDFGRLRFDRYFGGFPSISEDSFDDAFRGLIAANRIQMVFATHDTVVEYLSKIATVMGFALVNGDPATAAIARRKSLTYACFSDCKWVPVTFADVGEVRSWPIVVKPDAGQGGQGVGVAASRQEAAYLADKVDSPLFVEHLPGAELTVDCFTDRNRRLVWIGPRTRERIKAGITMRSRPIDPTPDIQVIAATINQRLRLRGPWFFQVKEDSHGKWKLLELSCRVSGAMVCQRAIGVNLPLMAVHDYLGRDLAVLRNPYVGLVERCIATRAELEYEYETVFVDLDDTLITDGQPNPPVLAFLYQAVRTGKRIKLITRHQSDIVSTLLHARIAVELFDEIIHVPEGDTKDSYLTDRAIFIDNHFSERASVAKAKLVPVLDVDALEFLIK